MDRSFAAFPSASQQQQQPQRRSKTNDSFRPALRFPTDPHKPGSFPQKVQRIPAPAPAAILLQSRRKPWEVDSTRLDDLVASTAHARKVIVVLGDPPSSALEPIVTSSYLSGSLVIVIASAESDLSISPQQCVPAIRILRLRPKPAGNPTPQQRGAAGSELSAEPGQLNASRLNSVLDWADRVGVAWRANPVGQTMFATLQEGEGPADGIGGKPWKWKSKAKLTSSTYTTVYDLPDGEGSLVPWAARFALNSRSNASSLASGGSSATSSIFVVETPGSDTGPARPSFSSSTGPKFVRNAMSTSNLATTNNDRDRSFDNPLSASVGRPGMSHAGHRSVPPPAKGLDAPAYQKRRFSLISFARGKMSPDPLGSSNHSKKSGRPSFDALINFLPPSSATGVDGALGRGAIATNHAAAAHNKLLLKQTILVTTAAQRFLVPVAHRGSGRSPGEGRFGGVTRSRGGDDGTGEAKKRWSVALIGSLFGVGDPVPSAKALGKRSALPTPPVSRPSSSEESGNGHGHKRPSMGGRLMSSVSAASASNHGPYPLPKLVHILPYGHGHMSTPVGGGSARLIRNLEAFLLSWSFGGPRFGEEAADDSGAENSGLAVANGSASGKRTVRPFLLDLAGLTDVLKVQLVEGDVEWPLADLILSGALDDEYPCTGGSPASTPSVPTPDVVVTRASTDVRSPTHARTPSSSKPKYGNDGLTLDSTPGPMEESWSARRAWLSGVGDLSIYPMPEGLGLVAAMSSPVGSNISTPTERNRTRSLGGPTPVARPRVTIGGVHSSSSSPVASPQLQTPPPPVPSKSFGPTSPVSGKPAQPQPTTRTTSHSRSQSSSANPPAPPMPPSQETSGSPSAPSAFPGRSNFPNEQPRYTRNPVPRPPQQSTLDSAEDRPRYYSLSDHGHGSVPTRSPVTQPTYASELRRGKSGSGGSPLSSTPIAAAFSRSREPDDFGAASPPTSWNGGTWASSSPSSSPYQVHTPSATLPSRSSTKNSDYVSSPSTRGTPSRGMTVPQSGGRWDSDSSDVVSSRPSVLRKKSIDERDRRYPSDPPPGPHPSFASSPKYPGAGRRPSEDNNPYFNGYEVAPPPLPTPPPRPNRVAPPNVLSRNRSTSSPLRHGVSAEGLNDHRLKPGIGGFMMDKRLPITPPDSASSSEVSNDMDMGRTSDREDKRKWWGTPTRVSARMI